MKILICEDDIMTLKALEHRLKKEGYETITAADGKQASELLQNNPEINFLLTDIHVPYISGLELISLVRDKLKKQIPIVVLTRVGLEDVVLRAFEMGADDYIVKPFSPDELSLRIKRQVIKNNL
ncbi:MAG: response regulator transcription factor [Bacteroidota bacterium]|nr:response regulator transcription factor [Bacteroidota bacterium]MDP4227600.1 response regulator transcription factor [Bacteroidota bacterium]MDP4273711.1 response regulator transcription factor [Bacteroidota bacterium]